MEERTDDDGTSGEFGVRFEKANFLVLGVFIQATSYNPSNCPRNVRCHINTTTPLALRL